MGEERQEKFEKLVAAIEREGDQPIPAIAVLWTWLEGQLQELGSRRLKGPEIVEIAERKPPYAGLNEEVRVALQRDPVLGAAETMARIAHHLGAPSWPLMKAAKGFDGEAVLVCWRMSEFVEKASGVDFPPTSREHPSLATLAPCVAVSPRDLGGGLMLEGQLARGLSWEAALGPLEEELASEKPVLSVHLDTLGSHGLSGWTQPDGQLRGHFGKIKKTDLKACEAAARTAVKQASEHRGASLLVFPELAAAEPVLDAIREELEAIAESSRPIGDEPEEGPRPPSFTVVGLRHFEAQDTNDELSDYVNEAVILGPNGDELWRHRKLTEAGAVDGLGEHGPFIEDIRLGDTLSVIHTQIGNFAVVICLDSFAGGARRIAMSPANVLLIPSLSPSVTPHRTSLQQLVLQLWAIAFVCNRSPVSLDGDKPSDISRWNDEKCRSFWVLTLGGPVVPPGKKDKSAHPSFVFTISDPRANGEPE